jgi:phosphatidylinositol alpha-1,6-mannosyltransferase
MRGVDLFVQPNIQVSGDMEGFGLTTIEAAMRGTPVVAADIEGIKDAVVAGRTGILIESAKPQLWRDGLKDLVSAPTDLPRLGQIFRAAAIELYSEAAMSQALCEQLSLATSR